MKDPVNVAWLTRLHVNPLRPKVLMAVDHATGAIRETIEGMPWGDAAIVASVLTAASFFTVYLTGISYDAIVADPGLCLYNAVVYVGKEWFTIFVALAGLGKLSERLKRPREGQVGEEPTAKTTSGD